MAPRLSCPFAGLALAPHEAFATPLGEVPVDRDAVARLAGEGMAVIDAASQARAHAIEVELPFLQMLFGDVPVMPIVLGRVPDAQLAEALSALWDEDTLPVISSELSHCQPCAHDARTAAAIERFDASAIGPGDACGLSALRGGLIVARDRGHAIARFHLRTSGDIAGARASVVGYGAWGIEAIGGASRT